MSKPIRLRLGHFTACAFTVPQVHEDRLEHKTHRGVTTYTVRSEQCRRHALAILYFMESAPAFWGDDAELVERSAIRRTSASWRKQLGLTLHEKLPTPYTANRVNINNPTEDERARERAEGNE
jgi:hypothetical protein